MSTEQLKEEVMSLPISEKVLLAQALWESINAGLVDTEEKNRIARGRPPGSRVVFWYS